MKLLLTSPKTFTGDRSDVEVVKMTMDEMDELDDRSLLRDYKYAFLIDMICV